MTLTVNVASYDTTAYIFAYDTTVSVGALYKPAESVMLVRLDYSQLAAPITNFPSFSFAVDVGSNPPLAVTSAVPGATWIDFILSGGLGGQQYHLTVTITGATTRNDTFTINVPLDDECGGGDGASVATITNSAGPSSTGFVYINSSIKYIVSTTTPVGANLGDQWYNPAVHSLYEYVTDGSLYWWQQLIATTPPGPTTFASLHLAPISPDGVTTQFVLNTQGVTAVNVLVSSDLLVSVDGVWQEPDTQYVASANQIQFVSPPAADSKVFIVWFQH